MRLRLRLLVPALCLPLALAGCGGAEEQEGPSAQLRDALEVVCGEGAAIEERDPDTDDVPEYSTRESEWADGRVSYATCDAGATVRGADYDEDPTADMEDLDESYGNADGTGVVWAVDEGDDEWVVVWVHDESGATLLAGLEGEGFEVVGA